MLFLQDPFSEERFHVELHFSPGVKGCEDEENAPMGFGFRPASAEVGVALGHGNRDAAGEGWLTQARRSLPPAPED